MTGSIRSAQYWREKLQLSNHIEGGSFRQVYKSDLELPQSVLSDAHKGTRSAATSIYFLLEFGEFSAFHRIASDELWHFYDGDGLVIYEIKPNGSLVKHLLGKDMEQGESLQVLIPAGSWFASRVEIERGFTLCGCTVSPGFDFADFELANRDQLISAYPEHSALISSLTRNI